MIDSLLQIELRNKFNPDGSDIRALQIRMLEMLKYIDNVCRENHITYWLSSGTCIGAIRHAGFIPWDDDVDIELKRKDYLKLLKILKQQNNKRYQLQDETTDADYLHPFAKLRDLNSYVKEDNDYDKWNKYSGCFIDIFCIEPSNSKLVNRVCASLWWRMVSPLSSINNSKIRRFCIKISRGLLTKLIYPPFRLINRMFNHRKYRHTLGTGFFKERYAQDINEVVYITFEDTVLPVPKNTDHYLRHIYGDYLKLPNLHKIHPHFIATQLLK